MGLTYFKRFRMEIDLRGRDFSDPGLPAGYFYIPWSRGLLEAHAEAKFHSFREEIDSNVFPCLGDYSGCLHLMEEIAAKPGFLPGATWLVGCTGGDSETSHGEQLNGHGAVHYCGTVQGVMDRSGMGAIQNLGVVPEYRGRGLGKSLMQQALAGFQNAGLSRAFLEVTAQNSSAVQLYKRLGFARSRTVYKVSEVAYA
jgi:ribosomal protein S18 acetylase RimI-like enzyme